MIGPDALVIIPATCSRMDLDHHWQASQAFDHTLAAESQGKPMYCYQKILLRGDSTHKGASNYEVLSCQ